MARSHAKSRELFERIKRSVAGGESSYARLAHGDPICVARGEGSRFWDVDGNDYIDFCLGYGPLILGHRPKPVIDAVVEQISDRGSMYTFPHVLDAEVGEKMQAAVPGLDLVRFANSGTEATLAAMRLARVYTGRDRIMKFEGQYHGWTDGHFMNIDGGIWSSGPERAPRAMPVGGTPRGVEDGLLIAAWQRREFVERLLRDHAHELAAVMCEPVMCNCGVIETDPEWLRWLRSITRELGILLIFDEVITGFRLALGGAREYFDVLPDIFCYGKALGGGFPVAAFGGSAEVMACEISNDAYHGGTYTGSPLVLAAANAVLGELSADPDVFYGHLCRLIRRLQDGIRESAARHGVRVKVSGYETVWVTYFLNDEADDDPVMDNLRSVGAAVDEARFSTFHHELMERGVYVHPGWHERWFVSSAHTDADVDRALVAFDEAMEVVKRTHG